MPLQLERAREDPVATERRGMEPDLLGQLKSQEPVVLALLRQLVEHHLHDGLVLAQLLERLLDALVVCNLHEDVFVGHHNGHVVALQGVSVQEYLGCQWAPQVDVLDLFRSNVLALAQLENVLLPVDDFEGAVGEDHAHIPSVDPPVLVDGLLGILLILVVASEDRLAPQADLPRWRRIAARIVHFRDVHELELHGGVDAAHMSGLSLALLSEEGARSGLGLPVSFADIAAQDDHEEAQHFRGNGCRPSDHELKAATEHVLGLFEDGVVIRRSWNALFPVGLLHSPRLLGQLLVDVREGLEHSVQHVEQSGYDDQDGWPDSGQVFEELGHCARVVPDLAAFEQHLVGHYPVERVRQRQIAQMHVVLIHRQLSFDCVDLRNEVSVSHDNAFRHPCRAAREAVAKVVVQQHQRVRPGDPPLDDLIKVYDLDST